jgi:stage II sporulation protein M
MEMIRRFVYDVRQIKMYIFVSVALFFAGVFIGYGSDVLDAYLLAQIEPLRDTVEKMESMENTQVMMFLFIFINNFLKSLLAVFLGALFGLFPVFFLVSNGLILGFVVSATGEAGGNVWAMVIKGILPHGVLELTAIMIASAFGLRYGVLVLRELGAALRGRTTRSGDLKAFHGTFKRLISFLFFALLLAAFIESTVTYFLVRG